MRARKVASDLVEELRLLGEFISLNDRAVYKAVKKFGKATGSGPQAEELRTTYMARLHAPTSPLAFLTGAHADSLRRRAAALLDRLRELEPAHAEWRRTRVYTIGCFDLVHHGHLNLLRGLRQFGNIVCVGIHDDDSYQRLKGEWGQRM